MKRVIPIAILMAFSARADILPGLEAYGDLTLVDEVDCATDTTHDMHDYPEGSSYATNILGSACRVMPHPSACAGYLSWKLGRGKGLVPHDMYLLVAEYPEDVARTVTLFNKGMDSRNGYYTGYATGQSLSGGVLSQVHPESVGVPLSGGWSRLEQTMILNENVRPRAGGAWCSSVDNGFDVIFQVFKASHAPDSAGAALRSVKLYRVNDEAGYDAVLRYPAGDVPRRYVTWREEMSANSGYESNADRSDNARHKVRLMKALGVNCYSRTMLEFGYNKNWAGGWKDTTAPWWNPSWGGGGYWSSSAPSDDYTGELEAFAAGGIYLLPYYEYSGSRGSWGPYDGGKALGYSPSLRAVPLFEDTGIYGTETNRINHYVKASNGASGANVDITQEPAYDDMTRILGCTILRYAGQANFVGAWIRNRGSMPVSFSDAALADFCRDTGRATGTVTRASILTTINGSSAGDKYKYLFKYGNQYWTDLYTEYRNWWNGKRADWLGAMRDLLAQNGVPGAKVFFTGPTGEVGLTLHAPNGQSNDHTTGGAGMPARLDSDWNFKSVNGAAYAAQLYKQYGLDLDGWTFYPYEYSHADPKADPLTYQSKAGLAMTYPYDTVYSTIAGGPDFNVPSFRNGSGDLFLSRFYCLHEGMNENESGAENNGYFTTEMDHAGRAIMLPELWGVLYQDPTIIGFLQGNHFARNFSLPFREFMENFLSLPAQAGTFVQGNNYWSSSFGVRKYVAGGETYIAVVNAGKNARAGQSVNTGDSSLSVLYETVSGRPVAVSGGKFTADFEPYQLKCYSTVAPDAPKFVVAVPKAAPESASIPLDVSTLGGATATRTVRVASSADFSDAVALPDAVLSSAGTNRIEIAGLAPNTRYWVSVGVTNGTGRGAARHFSFVTDVDPAFPRGSMEATPAVNSATLAVTLSALGQGANSCDLYAVFVPAASGLATLSKKIGTRNSTGACSFEVGPLSSEATYTAELFATNNLGYGTRLGVASVTTLAKPGVPLGEGVCAPGLIQAKVWTGAKSSMNKTFDILSAADATRVPGAAMAGVTANATTYTTQCYENPYDGQKFYYSKYDTTFGYAGEMYFESGKTYMIGKSYDDGVLVKIDGTTLLDHQQYNSTTTKTYTPSTSGWKPIEIRLWDGDGGKGPKNGWSSFTGVAYNTNGFTTISAETTGNWTPFMADAGAPLRCRSGIKSLASVGHIAGNGSMLIVPVLVDSYDEDNALAVYVTQDAAAAAKFSDPDGTSPDLSAWTRANGPAPAIGLGQTVIVQVGGLALSPGSTVYAIARLTNARTGYDVVSAAATYTLPADTTMPELLASLSDAGFLDAAFSINVLSMGTGASAITVSLEISGGGTSVTYTAASNVAGYSGVYRTPAELEYATDYTAMVAAINDLGKGATNTLHFSTLPCPIALSEASGLCNGAGTLSSASITVDDSTASSSLTLYVNDVAVSNWTAVAAGATYTGTVAITVGATNVFRFVLMADGCREIVRTVEVEGRRIVEWFTVPFTNDVYAAWAPATGEDPYAPEGARWTFYGAPGENTISTDGGERHLAISTGTDGLASYAPLSPSDEDRALEIFGRAKFSTVDECTPAAPDVPPIAAITVGTENGKGIFFGWADDKWNAFTDSSVNTNGWTLWSAKLDFANGTVEYSVDGTKLSSEGVTALPLAAAAARQASRVEFQGIGAVGSFQALYRDQDESGGGAVVLVPAAIRVDGTGVSFGNVGGSTSFVIGLTNARSDHWYVAFAADSLTTPSADWTCVACAAPENGATSVDLQCDTVDGDGHAIPTRFFRIFESTASIDLGTRYGDLGGAGKGKQE